MGPRCAEQGWAGMNLQPGHTVASGEDMGTKQPSKRAMEGHWAAREQPPSEGCEAISNNPPALGYGGYRSPSLSLLFNPVAEH